jgi:hypothetical protein
MSVVLGVMVSRQGQNQKRVVATASAGLPTEALACDKKLDVDSGEFDSNFRGKRGPIWLEFGYKLKWRTSFGSSSAVILARHGRFRPFNLSQIEQGQLFIHIDRLLMDIDPKDRVLFCYIIDALVGRPFREGPME